MINCRRVPDSFKDVILRKKKLQWKKDGKDTRICSLHFEANCFKGRRLDWKTVSASTSALAASDHDYFAQVEGEKTVTSKAPSNSDHDYFAQVEGEKTVTSKAPRKVIMTILHRLRVKKHTKLLCMKTLG